MNSSFRLIMLSGSFILSLAVLLFSCTEDGPEVDPQEQIKPFVGAYSVNGTALNEIVSLYDSVGNYIGQGKETIEFENEIIEISLQGETDTLLIDGLLYSWYLTNARKQAQGILEDNVIQLIYDESDIAFNRKITGTISITGDAIEMDYVWDKSDVWSGVPPVKGTVSAVGLKIE